MQINQYRQFSKRRFPTSLVSRGALGGREEEVEEEKLVEVDKLVEDHKEK